MELFELYLCPGDQKHFKAIVTQSTYGEGTADTNLPFWNGDQDRRTTIIKILESSGGFQPNSFLDVEEQRWMSDQMLLNVDRSNFHPDYLKTIGRLLYQSLFPDNSPVRQAFQACRRKAEDNNSLLNLRLRFDANSVQQSRLADYPWELIHDERDFLLHQRINLSRYIDYESSPPQWFPQERIRVLLVSAIAGDASQEVKSLYLQEQQAIRRGLEIASQAGFIELEALRGTRSALRQYLTEQPADRLPHVLHFDGHGLFGKRCVNFSCQTIHSGIKMDQCIKCGQPLPQTQGYLLFEGETGQPD